MSLCERTAVLMGGADPETGQMPEVPDIFTARKALDAMLEEPLWQTEQGPRGDPEQERLKRAVGLSV